MEMRGGASIRGGIMRRNEVSVAPSGVHLFEWMAEVLRSR